MSNTSACRPLYYREYLPSAALSPHVRAYFTFGTQCELGSSFRLICNTAFSERETICNAMFADTGTSIVIRLRDDWRIDKLTADRNEIDSYVIGPQDHGRKTFFGKSIDAIGIYFRVGGLNQFTDVPISCLYNVAANLEDVFANTSATFADQLASQPTIAARLMAIESFLLDRYRGPDGSAEKLKSLLDTNVFQRVSHIARSHGVTRQYLARKFTQMSGLAPKTYLRIARYQQVLQSLSVDAKDWDDIAAHHNYFDQSHLIADFRQFTTYTPSTLARSRHFHPFVANQ